MSCSMKADIEERSTMKTEEDATVTRRLWSKILGFILEWKDKVSRFFQKAWKLGVDDPRKVMHGLKVGLALTVVSLFYYTRTLYDGVGGNAMWAVMTVVVVCEFTVGGMIYKGFNRIMATMLAGFLAIGIHFVATKSGEKTEPVIDGASLFFLASAATFSRFIPSVKARFDYGVTIFILTFSLISISSYRVEDLLAEATQRLSTVAIGFSICLLICTLIHPVWAGGDLHLMVSRNFEKLASSLDGCVADYFDGKPSQKPQGYKFILNSKASEDSLANLARWEPSHGQFGFRHPWKQYVKIGVSIRYCAYCIESLNSSIASDIQTPEFLKDNLRDPCTALTSECCEVLKELANIIITMTDSSTVDLLVEQMNCEVGNLQTALRSLLPAEEEKNVEGGLVTSAAMSLIELLPIVTVASSLIEISVRIGGVADAVHVLTGLAGLRHAEEKKKKKQEKESKETTIGVVPQGIGGGKKGDEMV